MRSHTMVVLGAVMLFLFVGNGVAFADTNEVQGATNQLRTMFVTGKAEGFIPSDTIFWTITFTTTDKDVLKAKESNDQKSGELLQLLKRHGVQNADVSVGVIRTEDSGEGEAHMVTVTRLLTVRQTDFSRFSQVLEALTSVSRLKFSYGIGSSKRAEITRSTMAKAAEAAKDKAEAMAGILGARIRLQSLSEYPPPGWNTPDGQVPVDVLASGFGPDGEKITITLFVTFAIE